MIDCQPKDYSYGSWDGHASMRNSVAQEVYSHNDEKRGRKGNSNANNNLNKTIQVILSSARAGAGMWVKGKLECLQHLSSGK